MLRAFARPPPPRRRRPRRGAAAARGASPAPPPRPHPPTRGAGRARPPPPRGPDGRAPAEKRTARRQKKKMLEKKRHLHGRPARQNQERRHNEQHQRADDPARESGFRVSPINGLVHPRLAVFVEPTKGPIHDGESNISHAKGHEQSAVCERHRNAPEKKVATVYQQVSTVQHVRHCAMKGVVRRDLAPKNKRKRNLLRKAHSGSLRSHASWDRRAARTTP